MSIATSTAAKRGGPDKGVAVTQQRSMQSLFEIRKKLANSNGFRMFALFLRANSLLKEFFYRALQLCLHSHHQFVLCFLNGPKGVFRQTGHHNGKTFMQRTNNSINPFNNTKSISTTNNNNWTNSHKKSEKSNKHCPQSQNTKRLLSFLTFFLSRLQKHSTTQLDTIGYNLILDFF